MQIGTRWLGAGPWCPGVSRWSGLLAAACFGALNCTGTLSGADGDSQPSPALTPPVDDVLSPGAKAGQCGSSAVSLGMRALSENEANEVLHATFGPSIAFSSGSLGGNQTLGGKFANSRSRMPFDDAQFGKILDDALGLGSRIFSWLRTDNNCLTQTPADSGCSAEQLKKFARLLWRGNVAAESVQPIVESFTRTAGAWGAEEAVVQAFTALLVSPEFLYRFEFGRGTASGGFELAPLELAESLSFFVTGQPPTDALIQAAESGTLSDPAAFESQLSRLLDSPEAAAQFGSIIAQILEYRTTATRGNPNAALTPDLAQAMVTETDAYLTEAYAQNWSIAQMLSSKASPATSELAAYYGGGTLVNGTGSAHYQFPSDQRFGLLTQGSVLVGLSDPNKIAIVHRGRVLRDRVLCRGVPPPPPGVQNALPPPVPDQTERERVILHGQSPTCNQCHRYLDGIGFALDAFAGDGRYRAQVPTNDGLSSKPLSTSGTLEGVSVGSVTFADTAEFFGWLSSSDDAASCLTSSFVEYAQGANALPAGDCNDASAFLAAAPTLGAKDLLRRIARDKFFRTRAEL